jgi:hypothetical protein
MISRNTKHSATRHMEACRSAGKRLLDALDAIEDAEQKQKIQ